MTDIYSQFEQRALNIAVSKETDWKSDLIITDMLEHETLARAIQYTVKFANMRLNKEEIQYLVALNDRYGGAAVEQIGQFMSSPSSLRYVLHAAEILQLIISKNLSTVAICEVGGGYGGLALVLQAMANRMNIKISHYFIFDLEKVQELQKYYLGLHNQQVTFCSATTCGASLPQVDVPILLVSNYCMAEIDSELRKRYLQNLLPRVCGAYLRWNNTNYEGLPAHATITLENLGGTTITF